LHCTEYGCAYSQAQKDTRYKYPPARTQ
jgi:hypothetical protein